jgi:hypothetical protein
MTPRAVSHLHRNSYLMEIPKPVIGCDGLKQEYLKLWDEDNRSGHGKSQWRVWRRRYCEDYVGHHFRPQPLDVDVADEPKGMVSYAWNLDIGSCQDLFTQLNKRLRTI